MRKNPVLRSFGLRLRTLRTQKGLSQESLAEMSGLHRTYLGGVERGERNPTLTTLLKIAKGLGVSLAHLLAIGESRDD